MLAKKRMDDLSHAQCSYTSMMNHDRAVTCLA